MVEIGELLAINWLNITFILLGALAVAVPVLWERYRNRKGLSYELVASEPLRKGMPGLEVTFEGRSISNPHLCIFQIANSGRIPIAGRDFERPITIGFQGRPEHPQISPHILAYEVVDKHPATLTPFIKVRADGTIAIAPLLLNAGDSLTIRVLMDECFDRNEVNIDTRIEGVKNVRIPTEPWPPMPYVELALISVIAVTLATVISGNQTALGGLAVAVGLLFSVYLRRVMRQTKQIISIR